MASTDPPLLPAPEEPLLLPAPRALQPYEAPAGHPKRNTAIALAAFLVIAFAFGWFMHHRRSNAAEKANAQQQDAIPTVTVVAVRRSPALSELLLPGSLFPVTEAALYARASGYVKHRYVDIGDSVRKGQVLADIDSPELDEQVLQGQASVAQAKQQLAQARTSIGDAQVRLDLARVTVDRYESLLKQDSIARQDVDTQRQVYQSAIATLASAKANTAAAADNLNAARANGRRLAALQAFEKMRAPFDGIITARNVDEGALISNAGASLTSTDVSSFTSSMGSSSSSTGSSDSSGGSSGSSSSSGSTSSGGQGSELFRIANVDTLRVYVTVPQESATLVQVGSDASVFVQEFPDRFQGKISRTARALDPTARTLLTEVQIANAQHALMPGMYAQVRFMSSRASPPLLVPGEALITRASGTTVAVMEELSAEDRQELPASQNRPQARRVHLQPVVIGRDYGTEVEITQGLKGGEQVVLNPSDSVLENAVMVPQAPPDVSGGNGGKGNGDGDGNGNGKGNDKSPGKGQDTGKRKGDDKDQKNDSHGGQKDAGRGAARIVPPKPASAPAASAPAGGSSSPLAGPSDQSPAGLESPSMAAPSQGGGAKGSKGSK